MYSQTFLIGLLTVASLAYGQGANQHQPDKVQTPQMDAAVQKPVQPSVTDESQAVQALLVPAASPGQHALGPKRPGVTRIALAAPTVHMEGASADPSSSMVMGNQLSTLAASYLQAPQIEIVPLNARVAAAISSEAKSLDCDSILSINLIHVAAKSRSGLFSMASSLPMIGMIPGLGAVAGVGGAIAGTAASVAATAAAGMAANVHPKDTMTFEYKLTDLSSGNEIASNKAVVKAKQAGEDLITPLVSSMANTIVTGVLKPKQ